MWRRMDTSLAKRERNSEGSPWQGTSGDRATVILFLASLSHSGTPDVGEA